MPHSSSLKLFVSYSSILGSGVEATVKGSVMTAAPVRSRLAFSAAVLLASIAHVNAQVVLRVKADAQGGGDGTTWKTAFHDLQDALDAAAIHTNQGMDVQVWLAAGTYVPSVQSDPKDPATATFSLMNRLAIYGGFTGVEDSLPQRNHRANRSTLSGMDVAWHVVTATNTDSSAILD